MAKNTRPGHKIGGVKPKGKKVKPTDTIPVDARRAVLPIAGVKLGKRKT